MSTVANSLHPPPICSRINNVLDSLVDTAIGLEKQSPSLQNKVIVVLSKAVYIAGSPLTILAAVVETVASGIIGFISMMIHFSTGAKSLTLQKFTLQSFSYLIHSITIPKMIYFTLFDKAPGRKDLSTFEKHCQHGIAPASIVTQVPPATPHCNYRESLSIFVRFAYEKTYRMLPYLFCDAPETDPRTGVPVIVAKAMDEKTTEGKANLQSMMPTGLLGVAKYAQYLEIIHGTASCQADHALRHATLLAARSRISALTANEKQLLISFLIAGDTVTPELNRLTPANREAITKIASDITKLSSNMTEAPREGNYLQKNFARSLKDDYEKEYARVSSDIT